MHKLKSDDERRFLFLLMVIGGSALAIADQYIRLFRGKHVDAEDGIIVLMISDFNIAHHPACRGRY
jgi:hypothetical protein